MMIVYVLPSGNPVFQLPSFEDDLSFYLREAFFLHLLKRAFHQSERTVQEPSLLVPPKKSSSSRPYFASHTMALVIRCRQSISQHQIIVYCFPDYAIPIRT